MKEHVLFKEVASVKKACEPLSYFSIDGFIFMRRFEDGTFVDLSNQIEWSEDFLMRYLNGKVESQHAKDHMLILPGISLWSHNPSNTIWQEGRKDWGFHSGISIAKEGPCWTDIFCYYSRKFPGEMDSQYLKNIHSLEIFSQRFLDNFNDVIKKGEKNPLVTPKVYLTNNIKLTKEQQTFMNEFKKPVESLSIREKECIYYVAKGNTAEKVGVILHLSRRTVESHLQNAKDKLCINKLSDLIKLYHKHGFFLM